MATVDWYFDFVSPFAYMQSEQLHLLGPKTRIRYRPVLFAGLLAANAHKGPAEIPGKRYGLLDGGPGDNGTVEQDAPGPVSECVPGKDGKESAVNPAGE